MPIDLNAIVADASASDAKYTPKFFSSSITGSGGKTGWLSEMADPDHVKHGFSPNDDPDVKRMHRTDNGVDVRHTPMYAIPASMWDAGLVKAYPREAADWTQLGAIAKASAPNDESPLMVEVRMHSLIMEDDVANSHAKRMVAFYRVMFALVNHDDQDGLVWEGGAFRHGYTDTLVGLGCNPMFAMVTADPIGAIQSVVDVLRDDTSPAIVEIGQEDVDDYCSSLSAYEEACKAAERWNTTLDVEFRALLENCIDPTDHSIAQPSVLGRQVRMLEGHQTPLSVYMRIYSHVTDLLSAEDARDVCKENLNLLLSDTMSALDRMKPRLAHIPHLPPDQRPAIDPKFSREQAGAITAESPLVMTQAGAGTGKSSVVLARIKYMCDCGVEPSDITVLSFTNAAADHITELNPDVNSMTIAKMIHLIYTATYDHRLSTLDTLINAVDIYYGDDATARLFRRHLIDVKHNETGSFTQLNLFVETNFDWVMAVLDRIGQTTLELEIIVAYQNLENMVEPPDVTSRHLIIDEVQDCSVFEFVFALDYVCRHEESLFIVGGASLT